jgi:hypothetical protein
MKQYILRETSAGWHLSAENNKKIDDLENLIEHLKLYKFTSREHDKYLIIDKAVTKFFLFEIIEDYYQGKADICPF